ncbi:hypothetical protein PBI_SCTP2_450 [Salicola phage SCTP-2]|nr:hypothetical protein PBI_SCTP2_450 [Salicola phage SCTP-2]
MSFLPGSLDNDQIAQTGGNLFSGIPKASEDLAFSRADGPIEEALASVGSFGVNQIIDSMFQNEGKNVIPPQYSGETDIEIKEKDFWDTYSFANSKFFNETLLDNNVRYHKNHPMTKSLFLIDFEFNQAIANDPRLQNTYPKSMAFNLKNMTMPKATISTQKIPSYNIDKIITQKIDYEPISCSFGDIYTAYKPDNSLVSMLDFFQQYMSYYFNDFVADDQNLHYGYASGREFKQFIDNISIYFFWADGCRKIRLRNPMITSIAYEDLDYENDEQMKLNMDISYEYIDMHNLNISFDEFINSAGSLLNEVKNNVKSSNLDNPYFNDERLESGVSFEDDQRSQNLDNPAAQSLIRLAEIGELDITEDLINSENPLLQTVGTNVQNEGTNIISGATETGFSEIGDATNGLL